MIETTLGRKILSVEIYTDLLLKLQHWFLKSKEKRTRSALMQKYVRLQNILERRQFWLD